MSDGLLYQMESKIKIKGFSIVLQVDLQLDLNCKHISLY